MRQRYRYMFRLEKGLHGKAFSLLGTAAKFKRYFEWKNGGEMLEKYECGLGPRTDAGEGYTALSDGAPRQGLIGVRNILPIKRRY